MKLVIIFLISFALFCGREPAEDRAERNCRNGVYAAILLSNQLNDTPSSEIALLTLLKNSCNDYNDSTIDRYYRGYVLDKE